jgi:hypothetical protein
MDFILGCFTILCFVGWILNIVKLLNMCGDTLVLALRVLGIFFPPLGAFLGFL